jgi:hypothetical protein
MQIQYDFVPIRKKGIVQIAGGGIRVSGVLASCGWLEYEFGDGNKEKQLVSPETLFDSNHLESLKGMPLTLFHPEGEVNPVTYKGLTVGSVLTVTPNKQKQQLEGEIAINDFSAIEAVISGKITDLSCGYSVEKELIKDGEYKQIRRIPNHLSLVPEGRDKKAGLNLDSASTNIFIPTPKILFLGRY